MAGDVVSGTAVAVAAIAGPGEGMTVSMPTRVTVVNDDLTIVPDITESLDLKTEVLVANRAHVVVTAGGTVVEMPANALGADDTLEIARVMPDSAMSTPPGTVVAPMRWITLSSGQTTFAASLTIRIPYADTDDDGQVDGMNVSEVQLSLFIYDEAQDLWRRLPDAVTLLDTNTLVVQTTAIGLFAIAQAADGSVGAVNVSSSMPIQGATAGASAGFSSEESDWRTIGTAVSSPFAVAWNTASLNDGIYDLRAACSLDTAALATFEALTAAVNADSNSRNCFIATAAYGSALEPQVKVLRAFRDTYLLSTAAGRWLVEQYYQLSPPIADFIRDRESLRAVVRISLTPLVITAQLAQSVDGMVLLTGIALILLTGLGIGYGVSRRRRSSAW